MDREHPNTDLTEAYRFMQQNLILDYKIRRKKMQAAELRACLLPGAIRYDLDKVQTSPEDQMSIIVAELNAVEKEIEELNQKRAEWVLIAMKLIESLDTADEREKTVLSEFYISKVPMCCIMDDMHVSKSAAYRFRKSGMKKISEKIKLGKMGNCSVI